MQTLLNFTLCVCLSVASQGHQWWSRRGRVWLCQIRHHGGWLLCDAPPTGKERHGEEPRLRDALRLRNKEAGSGKLVRMVDPGVYVYESRTGVIGLPPTHTCIEFCRFWENLTVNRILTNRYGHLCMLYYYTIQLIPELLGSIKKGEEFVKNSWATCNRSTLCNDYSLSWLDLVHCLWYV